MKLPWLITQGCEKSLDVIEVDASVVHLVLDQIEGVQGVDVVAMVVADS